MSDPRDRVGHDPEVMRAIHLLDQVMVAAAAQAGVKLVTLVVAWVTEDQGGDLTVGSLIAGEASDEVLGHIAETIVDEACDAPVGGVVLQ